MARFVKAAEKGEVEEGKGKAVDVEGRAFALFRVKDEYFAIGNTCLHRGGPLGQGDLKGYVVTCPWHGWKFDVRTGSFAVIPTLKVKTFPVKQDEESLLVDVSDSDHVQQRPSLEGRTGPVEEKGE